MICGSQKRVIDGVGIEVYGSWRRARLDADDPSKGPDDSRAD